jgi:hypothetical protein
MKPSLPLAAVLALTVPVRSDPAPGNNPKPIDDNELLAGTWKLTEIELAHNPTPPGSDEKWVIGEGRSIS